MHIYNRIKLKETKKMKNDEKNKKKIRRIIRNLHASETR